MVFNLGRENLWKNIALLALFFFTITTATIGLTTGNASAKIVCEGHYVTVHITAKDQNGQDVPGVKIDGNWNRFSSDCYGEQKMTTNPDGVANFKANCQDSEPYFDIKYIPSGYSFTSAKASWPYDGGTRDLTANNTKEFDKYFGKNISASGTQNTKKETFQWFNAVWNSSGAINGNRFINLDIKLKRIIKWDLQGITWPQGSAKPAYDNRNRIVQEVDMSNVNTDKPVVFNHEIRNMSGNPATFTFYTQGCYASDGNILNCDFKGTGRLYNPFADKETVGLGTNLSAGKSIGPFTDNTTTISVNAPNGSIYCQRVVYRDQDGPGGPSNELVAGLSSCFKVKKGSQFELKPTGSIKLNDDENPSQAVYDYCVELNKANVTSIGANISVRLYKNGIMISNTPNNASITVNSPKYCVNNQTFNVSGLNPGDQICITTFVTPTSNSDAGTANSGSACDTVVNKPTFGAKNGSVSAGQCSSSSGGYLGGWFNNVVAQQQWSGSATNLAAFASAKTVGFASARGNAGNYGSNVLTFAKDTIHSPDNDSPFFGTAFGNVPCLKDLVKDNNASSGATTPGNTLDWSSITADDKQYSYTGKINIPTNNPYNGKASIDVDGDVYISGNIVYKNSDTWTDATQIPKLIIRAKGNIYISNSVTRLDGVYIAKPKDASSGGAIYTCADTSASNGIGYTYDDLWAKCGGSSPLTSANSLTVYGVFIANKINLLRTAGSLRSSGNIDGAAEKFILSPEVYLNGTNLYTSGSSSGVLPYDAIYNLPPIL